MVTKKEYDALKERLRTLEGRVGVLEDKNGVLEKVAENLRKGVTRLEKRVDDLDQYGRRSNIILQNIEVKPNENQQAIETQVKNIVEKELKLPNAAKDIDKLHRLGKKKEHEGKTYQNVIVRFRSHRQRYAVYKERSKLQHGVKMNPNLTKKRGTMLYKSSKLVENVQGVDFTFANIHGDLCVRLTAEHEGRNVWTFQSLGELKKLLGDRNIQIPDDVENEGGAEEDAES